MTETALVPCRKVCRLRSYIPTSHRRCISAMYIVAFTAHMFRATAPAWILVITGVKMEREETDTHDGCVEQHTHGHVHIWSCPTDDQILSISTRSHYSTACLDLVAPNRTSLRQWKVDDRRKSQGENTLRFNMSAFGLVLHPAAEH